MTATTEMHPTLDALSEQAEAIAARDAGLPEGRDELPEAQRAAWRRVLRGCAANENVEEWVVEPILKGLTTAGMDEAAVLRFFRTQGVDELRHRDQLSAYLERHWDEPHRLNDTVGQKVVYEGIFRTVINASAQRPLRMLMPMLFYERAGGLLYMTRLVDCVPATAPRLRELLRAIRTDEARHVAGVGLVAKAMVAHRPPGATERALIAGICKLACADMDRTAWWKPGLAGFMRDLGLDAAAMRRDNEMVLADTLDVLEGRS